jgi:hypothetical protein
MVDQRVAAEKQNGVGTPYIPPMTRRLKCRIDPEQSPYTCMLPVLRLERPQLVGGVGHGRRMPPISRMIKDVIIRKNRGRGLLSPSASN